MSTTPTRKTSFTRRVPDHVTDELVNVLSPGDTLEFNELFKLVYANLKVKNAVSGGEEMLRLRSYEKLQGLVNRGLCAKAGKLIVDWKVCARRIRRPWLLVPQLLLPVNLSSQSVTG